MKSFYALMFTLLCSTQSDSVAQLFEMKAIDYKCVMDCTAKGYMYAYCQKVCEY